MSTTLENKWIRILLQFFLGATSGLTTTVLLGSVVLVVMGIIDIFLGTGVPILVTMGVLVGAMALTVIVEHADKGHDLYRDRRSAFSSVAEDMAFILGVAGMWITISLVTIIPYRLEYLKTAAWWNWWVLIVALLVFGGLLYYWGYLLLLGMIDPVSMHKDKIRRMRGLNKKWGNRLSLVDRETLKWLRDDRKAEWGNGRGKRDGKYWISDLERTVMVMVWKGEMAQAVAVLEIMDEEGNHSVVRSILRNIERYHRKGEAFKKYCQEGRLS